jgi:arylsulfatase A-like enzyme
LADIPLPVDRTYDGQDIWPFITGQSGTPVEMIYYSRGEYIEAVREGPWKLRIANTDGHKNRKPVELELYNLDVDPYELYNVADRHPDIAEKLHDKMKNFASDVDGRLFEL